MCTLTRLPCRLRFECQHHINYDKNQLRQMSIIAAVVVTKFSLILIRKVLLKTQLKWINTCGPHFSWINKDLSMPIEPEGKFRFCSFVSIRVSSEATAFYRIRHWYGELVKSKGYSTPVKQAKLCFCNSYWVLVFQIVYLSLPGKSFTGLFSIYRHGNDWLWHLS